MQKTGNPRASVGEVYAQITNDLQFASTNLTADRRAKWAINENVSEWHTRESILIYGSLC